MPTRPVHLFLRAANAFLMAKRLQLELVIVHHCHALLLKSQQRAVCLHIRTPNI